MNHGELTSRWLGTDKRQAGKMHLDDSWTSRGWDSRRRWTTAMDHPRCLSSSARTSL